MCDQIWAMGERIAKQRSPAVLLLFGLAIVLLLVTGVMVMTGHTIDEDKIEIGGILILSGVGANEGMLEQKGVQMAIDEINSAGGVNGKMLNLNVQDNQGDSPKTAVSALRYLSSKGINVVIGTSWSSSAVAVAPIACREGILMISPSAGVRDFNEECDYLFNVWMHDDDVSQMLGQRIYDDGYRRLAILGSQQTWEIVQAQSVKEGFELAGGDVVAYELPTAEETDFRTNILRIKESGADAIYVQYSYQDLVARQLKEAGLDIQLYAVLTDMTRIGNSEGSLDSMIVTTQVHPSEEFVKKFEARYGVYPDIGADNSYDTVMLIAKAMSETGSEDPKVLKDYLNGLESYDGASGQLIFDGLGGVKKDIGYVFVENGALVDL